LGVTRQPISKFFNGKPVACELFVRICERLQLDDWQVIAQKDDELEVEQSRNEGCDIDALVQEIREKVKPNIRERCGKMRVLDMNQPIELTGERGIYTNVNILEKITGRRRLDIAELLQSCDADDFERFGLNKVTEKRVPGLEAVQRYSKLMVLGKPGAGKTTFLKYLAMQCIEGQFQANRVPLFITLKDFAEKPKQPDVLEYIGQQLSGWGMTDASVKVEQLLRQGKALVLLDGLDEVREEDTKQVVRQIREISDQLHTNQFVITCRIAAKDYTFERFTEVEVADFDLKQIAIFAQNWFQLSNPVKAERFIQKLQENKPIQELATNPLLLTLLCLVFGENADFPANRSELYKEGLDVLLKKWDAKRDIERDQVYKNLSVQRKEDLLSQIALTTFEQKDYFFKQKMVEANIADFIRNLYNEDPDPEVLRFDSEAVLKSVEWQHGLLVERAKGIYSFSHLTFQEYFTAREIVANSALEKLIEHIIEKRWREVFLLTTGMMRKADELMWMMKHRIDSLTALDPKLQEFLAWVNQKSISVNLTYKPLVVRAFYFSSGLWKIRKSFTDFDTDFKATLDQVIKAVYYSRQALETALEPNLSSDSYNIFDCVIDYCSLKSFCYPSLQTKTVQINETYAISNFLASVRATERDFRLNDALKLFSARDNKLDLDQLRAVMIEHRNIGHDWQFSKVQEKLLQQYYDANKLLIDCLNSDCYVSREVRQEIEDTLMLPMAEIEKRKQGKVD
jgi:predicted NACHT family NTPase